MLLLTSTGVGESPRGFRRGAACAAAVTSLRFVAEGRKRFDGAYPASVVLTHPVAWDEQRQAVLRAARSSSYGFGR